MHAQHFVNGVPRFAVVSRIEFAGKRPTDHRARYGNRDRTQRPNSLRRAPPSRRMAIRSAIASASSVACEMNTMETPDCFQALNQREEVALSPLLESKLAVGSSNMINRAFCKAARAISTICFWAAPVRLATTATGSTLKLSDCRNCCAAMLESPQSVEKTFAGEIQVLRDGRGRL